MVTPYSTSDVMHRYRNCLILLLLFGLCYYQYYYCCCYFGGGGGGGGYVNLFRSYLTNRQPLVRVSGIFSSPFVVVSGVHPGSVLGPRLFSVYINDLCDAIN
jgi:hypothetical protein